MTSSLILLIRERFPLGQYGPLILAFTLANGLYFQGPSDFSHQGVWLSLVILTSAFLRLRLFDEMKDLETDLKINPSRPLARGAVQEDQVRTWILLLLLLEFALSWWLGPLVFVIHSFAILFSLLMFEEFFVGSLLRPHLTTYAVSHTFVSVLLAATSGAAASGGDLERLASREGILFLLANWMFFNLFEFARKTYAPSEERESVMTYSSLFGVKGALLLSLSQVALGLGLLQQAGLKIMPGLWLAGALYTGTSIVVTFRKQAKGLGLYRLFSGLYLLTHYVLLSFAFVRAFL